MSVTIEELRKSGLVEVHVSGTLHKFDHDQFVPIIEEVEEVTALAEDAPQGAGHGEDELALGDLVTDGGGDPVAGLADPALVAGGIGMANLAGEGSRISSLGFERAGLLRQSRSLRHLVPAWESGATSIIPTGAKRPTRMPSSTRVLSVGNETCPASSSRQPVRGAGAGPPDRPRGGHATGSSGVADRFARAGWQCEHCLPFRSLGPSGHGAAGSARISIRFVPCAPGPFRGWR